MSEIGIKLHLRRLADLLKVKDQKGFADQVDTSQVVPTLDVLQGGFAERVYEYATALTGNPSVSNLASWRLISPVGSFSPAILNNDGKDRRVLAADINMVNMSLGLGNMQSWHYYLKPDPDSATIISVLWAHKGSQVDAENTESMWLTLTGYLTNLPSQGNDPPYVGGGAPAIACTWNRVVPAGWEFWAAVRNYGGGGTGDANFPVGSSILWNVATAAAPAGIRLLD